MHQFKGLLLGKKRAKKFGARKPPPPHFRAMPESKRLFSTDVFPYIACAKLTFMSSPFLSANVSPPSSLPPTSSEILNFQHFPQLNTHALIRKGFHKFC